MGHTALNRQTSSIKMKAIIVLSLICVSQFSSALIAEKRDQEPECETMGGTCETKEECHKTMGSMVVEGKCVRQQFDVDAKFCCVKSPGDGSGPGVIAADAGTPKGGTTCPGHSLEICIKTCPSSNACIYGGCVRDCTKKCADDIDDCIDDTPDEYDY